MKYSVIAKNFAAFISRSDYCGSSDSDYSAADSGCSDGSDCSAAGSVRSADSGCSAADGYYSD